MQIWKWAASSAVLAVCLSSAPALAQDEPQAAEPTVEGIIVTAQKREQNLQDVPIVVNVVSGQQLQDAGVRDVKDLQLVTPGLNVTSSTSEAQTSIRIRGVGTIGDNPGLESSVGTVVDGVYRARSGVAFGDLGELERVEVLKGPQGTLFGKNTSAGVINVITKEPEFDFGVSGELTAGNYGTLGGSVSVTGPIAGDVLAGRLFVAKRQRDGFYDVRTGAGPRTLKEDADQDYWTARGQLLFLPTESLTIRLLADYTKRDEHCCVNVTTFVGPTGAIIDALAADEGTMRPADPWRRTGYANRETVQEITDQGVSLQADWDITPDIALTSITAWRSWKAVQGSDIDYSSADIWYRPADGRTFSQIDVFSQELRVAGTTDRFDWMVGAFYSDEQLNTSAFTALGAAYEPYFGLLLSGGANPATVSLLTGLPYGSNFPAGEGPYDRHDHASTGWALFTNNTFRVFEGFEITFGLRYTSDEKDVFSRYRNTVPASACAAALVNPIPAAARAAICAPHTDPAFDNADVRQSRSEDRLGGTLKVSYRFTPEFMTYVSYASSHKSGGFNLDRSRITQGVLDPDTSFPAETVEAYELGFKSTLLDNSLYFNGAIFHQTFEDFQLNTYTGVSWLVASIPEVISKGVDLDLIWRTPVEGLTFTSGVTYAETQYGEFVPPAGISPRLPGARLSYAPLWSASWSASYEKPFAGGLMFRASLSGKYTSQYNTGSNLDPRKNQDSLTLWNGRVSIGSEDERWAVEAWAQNLTDENYYQVVVDQPLQSGTYAAFLGAPMTAGLTLRVKY
jgi:outer membrane receptor protein involved in Fe transport